LGFHWEWFAVKATGPDILDRLIAVRGSTQAKVLTKLSNQGVHEALEKYAEPTSDWLACASFQGWTFVQGSVTFWGDDVVRIAKELDADACVAAAESTTWVLMMEYAKPNGNIRTRSFMLEGSDNLDNLKFTVVRRTASQGPLKRDDEGKETSEGSPLPGEPLDIVVADDERLLRVLQGIGVPLDAFVKHHIGWFDWKRMVAIDGPGAREPAFTLFIEGPLRTEAQPPPSKRGLLSRLRGR